MIAAVARSPLFTAGNAGSGLIFQPLEAASSGLAVDGGLAVFSAIS